MLKLYCNTGLRWLWLALLIIVIDRLTKEWVLTHLIFGEPLVLLPIFNLTLAYNTGAAFSFLHTASGWQNIVLGGLAVIMSLVILYWLYRQSKQAYWLNSALCLILGGAIGNAWDRVRYGYVIDFLDVHVGDWHFAIFNVADSAISVGAVMLLLHWIKNPISHSP
ncbi:MAG TPA: signal peptidase II [Gammaproteobacteria bacterium]|nr:signal peptidase II [Gammaproteobacteria bacterium]